MGRPAGWMHELTTLASMLLHHANGALKELWGKLRLFLYGFILSGIKASSKSGAIHRQHRDCTCQVHFYGNHQLDDQQS